MDEILDPELEKLKAEQEGNSNKKLVLGLAGGIGDTLASRQGFGNFFLGKMAPQSNSVSKFTGSLAEGIQDPMERKRKAMEYVKSKREQTRSADEDDAMSADSVAMQEQIAGVFPQYKKFVEGKSKAQIKELMPILSKKIEGDTSRENARISAGGRAQEKADAKAEKLEIDKKERTTTFGVARTPDDAKNLKAASELKQNFDSKLEEMIALREKHKGGAILNRDDVNRGKALSDDLLLAYKDLSKLGVMSKTDEAILRRIIPADPLQYNSPISAIQGQDPTLHQMKNFKSDSDRDFQTRLKSRLESYEPPAGDRKVVKKYKGSDGSMKVVYSDKTEEIIPATAGN